MIISRRSVVYSMASAALIGATGVRAGAEALKFSDILDVVSVDENLLAQAAGRAEPEEFLPATQLTATSNGRKSLTKASSDTIRMIVMFEVSSKNVYTAKYQGAIWPKGRSGITVGVGYDFGYVSNSRAREDWAAYVAPDMLSKMLPACGLKGQAAKLALSNFNGVQVPWDSAYRQFNEQTLPRYIGEVEDTLFNTNLLSPDSLGALVSLSYNRGCSFNLSPAKDPTGRFAEMRAIALHMQRKDFGKVPNEIRKMKRIWVGKSDMAGLLVRRELEAKLFEVGLQ